MSNSKIYLIDVSGLCYRAYYAILGLATSYGQPTGAVFGFINILNKILKEKPEYLACCFDVSRQTFRQKKYKDYKINRPAMPDGLSSQMQLIREVVCAYNIVVSELEGFEADDVIATLSRKAKEKSLDVFIVSSDKDILQLVDEKVKVLDPKKDKEGLVYDNEQVRLRYGLEPNRMIDIFSLTGDPTDNIPGVKGIGEKTAQNLIKEFGSLDNLIKNIEQVKSKAIREAIQDNLANIRLSYDLLKLADNLDIDFELDKLKYKEPDYDKLFTLFKKLEFNSLLKKISINTDKDVHSRVRPVFIENNNIKEKALRAIRDKNELFFIVAQDIKDRLYFLSGGVIYSIRIDDNELRAVFSDSAIKKISHNLKEAKIFLLRNHIDFKGMYFDTMLAAYLLDSSIPEFGLAELAFRYLGLRYPQNKLSPEDSLDIVAKLTPLLKEKIEQNSQSGLFYDLEMPLAEVLAAMHLNGVKIDAQALNILSKELEDRLIKLRSDIYVLNNGQEFNLNSPKQLSDVLFNRLKLPVVKKTKTGLSTDEEVLRKLAKEHRLPVLILEYRNLTKLKNTYIDSLPLLIDPQTRRIHANFDQVGTETGRLSSNNPNLQNIPIKGDIAGLIRKAFIAESGNLLISADYSQIELRVLAHFSGDETLISAFSKDSDIHRYTASLIFQVDENLVSDEMRDTAKRINFGIVYGMGSFGLSKDLGISLDEAKAFIDEYFLRYPKVKKFIAEQIKLARESGYVKTLLERRRNLGGINSKDNAIRSFAERQAVNSPIQGSAADLIKLAMINIHNSLEQNGFKSKLIMQIHDELVFETPSEELKEAASLIKDKMENVYKLIVPIKVNIKTGKNWLEMELS